MITMQNQLPSHNRLYNINWTKNKEAIKQSLLYSNSQYTGITNDTEIKYRRLMQNSTRSLADIEITANEGTSAATQLALIRIQS